jgi:hypothetical protein
MPHTSDDRAAVTELAYMYADALDRRDWAALDAVFAEDVHADYAGLYVLDQRRDLVAMIRGFLDPCGPTQHLMGNPRVALDGDTATLTVKMRVHHIGTGERSHLTYECFGWYHAEAMRTANGAWQIRSWRQEVTAEVGTQEVFAGS